MLPDSSRNDLIEEEFRIMKAERIVLIMRMRLTEELKDFFSFPLLANLK